MFDLAGAEFCAAYLHECRWDGSISISLYRFAKV